MKHTTRRGILGAIAAVPAAALLAGQPASALPAIHGGGRWQRLKARYDRIVAAAAEYDRAVYRPAWAAVDADTAKVPHTVVKYPGWTWLRGVRQDYEMTTADYTHVNQAERALKRGEGYEAEYITACRKIVAGHKRRVRTLTGIEARHGIPAISDRADKLGDLEYRLKWQLMGTPAPDLSGALWKVDQLLGDHEQTGCVPSWSLEDKQVSAAIADIRRLLSGEA